MGRSYDTGIDVRTCAYIRRPFWHLSIIPLLKGGAKSPRLFKNLNLAAPGTISIPQTSSVACHMPRSSKIDIQILYSATVREILSFFIPRNLLPSFRYFFAPSLMEAKAGQIPMPIVPNRRSSFGMSCAHCDNELIAPEWSEYRNERQVRHVWHCSECSACFGSLVVFPADTSHRRRLDSLRPSAAPRPW